ncbi:hypothetical protein FQN54_000791 [Arachnomyces sp. PD_36]|nr:hypothetical protein FQN54_000791 [Arachnomyces sp. PD_36]
MMLESRGLIVVGVLALQGAFYEHIQLLEQAAVAIPNSAGATPRQWKFIEVRTAEQLSSCDALIIPGGESTAMSLVAARSGLLDPLRDFVKLHRKPTWGTCAGLILLAESANRTKKGGQELIGGLDVRVNRNHFGRQTESFQAALDLPFLAEPKGSSGNSESPFTAVFIRAPVVEKVLPHVDGIQVEEQNREETIVAPTRDTGYATATDGVEVLATLPGRAARLTESGVGIAAEDNSGDIVAVRQGNVFGTSFHPELTNDSRIHEWWLRQIEAGVAKERGS